MKNASVRLVVLLTLASTTLCYVQIGRHHAFDAAKRLAVHDASIPFRSLPFQKKALKNDDVTIGDSSCTWIMSSQCVLSFNASQKLIAESDGAYAKYFSSLSRCTSHETEDQCKTGGGCTWFRKEGGCALTDLADGHEDSVCVKDAKQLFVFLDKSVACKAYIDASSCAKDEYCRWYDEFGCHRDFERCFFGFSEVGLIELQGEKIEEAVAEFREEFTLEDPEFSWDVAFQWEGIKDSKCPEAVDPKACEYIDLYVKYIVPILFYCGTKYSSFLQFPQCSKDPLCTFDLAGFSCGMSRAGLLSIIAKSQQELATSVKGEVDKTYLLQRATCMTTLVKEQCTGALRFLALLQNESVEYIGNCQWMKDDQTGYCVLRDSSVYAIIAGRKGGEDDPVCRLFGAIAATSCLDALDKDTCLKDYRCVYLSGCGPNEVYMMATVLVSDKELQEKYIHESTACAEHTTKAQCETA